jgi:hypothetical protein
MRLARIPYTRKGDSLPFKPLFKRVEHKQELIIVIFAKIVLENLACSNNNSMVQWHIVLDSILLLLTEDVKHRLLPTDSRANLSNG